MAIRRCPQCGTATDDMYGFCIKCGYEFPKIPENGHICPLCNFPNPDEADFCVKCGTPLVFKNHIEGNQTALNPIVIRKEVIRDSQRIQTNKTSSWIIILGYIFSILGGLIGLIIAIYLSTRKDPNARKHGHIQLAIFGFYMLLIIIFFATGQITPDTITNYTQLISGNFTPFQR